MKTFNQNLMNCKEHMNKIDKLIVEIGIIYFKLGDHFNKKKKKNKKNILIDLQFLFKMIYNKKKINNIKIDHF